jgi:SAM-dependent methyltransferase
MHDTPAVAAPFPAIAGVEFVDAAQFRRYETAAWHCARLDRERAYARAFASEGAIPGWCEACEEPTRFRFESGPAGLPNWRESLHCPRCGLFSRVRFSLALANRRMPLAGSRIFATEQTTPLYAWLRLRGIDIYGSEYVTDPARREALGHYVATTTHGLDTTLNVEDVTRLTLADGSRDLVLSFDVLEHVPDYRAALREFHRVLADGGMLVLTVPFDTGRDETLVRARLRDGAVEHLVEPEYHGDPASDSGCLAFYTFGWSLLDEVRDAGFADVRVACGWAPAYGYLGGQQTLLARRAAA